MRRSRVPRLNIARSLIPLILCIAVFGMACTRQIGRTELLAPEEMPQLRSAQGVEVVGFVRSNGDRVAWPGVVFVEPSGELLFSRGGRLGDHPSETGEGTLRMPADSLSAIVVRNELATGAVAAIAAGALLLAFFAWGISTIEFN